MFKVRKDEPDYAYLPDAKAPRVNHYGKNIDLSVEHSELTGKSLNINGDSGVSDNPDRYKQHGFYFNADNCISCHACESACSEKNDLPPYLAYRAVGYVEGGTYPSYTRLNISMACNHCDNPVCLKGCPTRAYTKFAEYGAVLQDPDICFGCGYCTWVCPYNAPQMDTKKGHVHKCNMCVDRLEVGLKPACSSACLAGALDFGVIETTPENRDQLKTSIPGFPTTDITNPNIRFQQTKTLPRDMYRTDSTALKYHRNDETGEYEPMVDEQRKSDKKFWNLKKLLTSHENAHIAFTLSAQTVIGAFFMVLFAHYFGHGVGFADFTTNVSAAYIPVMATLLVLLSFGMAKLNLHLGRPHRFYRGFYNWRMSPVSREIAGVSLFFAGIAGYALFAWFNNSITQFFADLSAIAAVIGGVGGFYYMYKLYRIPARPYWNHWQTASSFIGSALALGGLLVVVVISVTHGLTLTPATFEFTGVVILIGLVIEALGLLFHARDMKCSHSEGAVSHYEQTTTYGKSYLLRNILLVANIIAVSLVSVYGLPDISGWVLGVALSLSILSSAVIGRALFYVLVIPTTMPGAFFWRNKGFEEHARETGLADMPQTGVLADGH
ncbi:Anaerobic dimethyl sulfoxide reductase chain B, iron-sulfur binding subunit [hydrothermal vent metagenome]|uniref:Anaerobic dimethyl sulfoxide reductase chain B, iron-sulfur binding subunit n=1 Tax=hydrothermal vent metagenome TaxID=652676 RepID=A0A3B0ZD05_9ZZZZ